MVERSGVWESGAYYTWVGAMVLILFALSFDHWVVKLTGVAHMGILEGY